jgi:uncharacterized low-complexity protein
MKITKTVKGLAVGTSLAAFVTLGVPATSHASNLLGKHAQQVGDKKAEKKKDDKKKDEKKKDEKKEKGEGEGSCGEGSCGEGQCGGKDKEKDKK